MLDAFIKYGTLISICIILIVFVIGVIHYTRKFVIYLHDQKIKKQASITEMKRIEAEKEIAYKMYLDAKKSTKEVK